MLDTSISDWDPSTLGEINHRNVKPPYVRLASYTVGENGDVAYLYDLRLTQPNQDHLDAKLLHSLEHLFLAGFRKYMQKKFVCVAPMGCQTGFYLILLNEGTASRVLAAYEHILLDIANSTEVPYANLNDCGQADYHDLANAKRQAQKLLECKSSWLQVL